MEGALQKLDRSQKTPPFDGNQAKVTATALGELQTALQSALAAFLDAGGSVRNDDIDASKKTDDGDISATWLLNLCQTVPSELDELHLARAILQAAQETDEAQQQAALFDALGASDQAMGVLLEVAPLLSQIRQQISVTDLEAAANQNAAMMSNSSTRVDVEEERRQFLLREAIDAAQVAAIAQAEVDELMGNSGSSSATHTVLRTSEIRAKKFAEKASRRAAQAMQRAKDAGAVIDESELLSMDRNSGNFGDGGLMNRSQEEVWALQQSLLPEGSREYYDHRGLPRDAIRVEEDGMEKVIIPAAKLDKAAQHERLKIADIMDDQLGKAFAGTTSLNPMQSATFDVAFHSRDNMMVCSPTGSGKTNVAMLTVAAHFRDVGLISSADGFDGTARSAMETGKKVVYIAPMKALAQEVVEKFSSKLKPLRLIVRELTGDMQLTRAEAESANVIVTTPEKWDVVTRKGGTDENSLGNQCGLLIIDEVHLLADERGAVIESVVSRLHRLVESRQRQVRIVALSATLPNYDDVANFLQVPERGIFFFGPEHRPVPLQQTFIGVNAGTRDRRLKEQKMNEICFDVVLDSLQRGYQVMVFVHSRKGTGDTANALADLASQEGVLERSFMTQGKEGPQGDAHKRYSDRVKKSRNREVGAHFENGMGIHHAGMLRGDRKLTEQMFNDGAIKVLCCTATLAWGINLPAHSVVIKGTEVYNPEKGGIVDLSILDVQQIFGRAGRPQFDSSGEATLITTGEAFPRYMDKLVRPIPIESNFIKQLADHLNAEVVGGTVSNLREASRWLTYTYLYIRMLRNPLAYGINADQKADDPMLKGRCLELVTEAAKLLDSNKMLRLDLQSGNLGVADNGRVAAHFYIQAESVATFNEMLSRRTEPTDGDLCRVICSATEFCKMKLRQEELDELQKLAAETCPLKIKGAGGDGAGRSLITDSVDKAFVLMQAYISRAKIRSFTLISDTNYIAANAGRVARALFEICLKKNAAGASLKLLRIAKSVDQQNWWFRTPLRHFEGELRESVYSSIENNTTGYDTLETALSLLEMRPEEVGQLVRWNRQGGEKVQMFVGMLPKFSVTCNVKPITSSVVRFQVHLLADFQWHGRWHGGAQSFWMWVEDGDGIKIRHHEHIILSRRMYEDPLLLDFSIPLFGSSPKQYFIRIIADGWVGVDQILPVSFRDVEMPSDTTPHTDLLDLTPLPTSALNNPKYEQLYSKFDTFNPIQTQLFHVLYHTDSPVLLGAPTGSGKTLVAELAILRMKRLHPKGICVYIAPLKALARERLKEWQRRFGSSPLHWTVLELSGDTNHDVGALERADILVATPEKWDLISRGWRGLSHRSSSGKRFQDVAKDFVFRVRLLIIDEAHLLGEERGAVLEAIVSRTRFISRYANEQKRISGAAGPTDDTISSESTRIIGLTTALANPGDLADWIGIDTKSHGPKARRGLYNFRPSVRPVPTKVHVQGYPGKHYCPRMATMNKPCFAAIKELSPQKPVLIFVASRRQTRLTAFDIISYAAAEENPKIFLGCSDTYAESVAERISDEALRHTITFGIGLHHAGLSSSDRDIVEKMFLKGEIQVLVATATLAWGVNLPAHLVIVKGTEFFDGKTSRYVPYPLTDVLQMIGRAGRPGFDTSADAVVMVVDDMKNFYKKFLYTPFPVESCLDERMNENLNAEIAGGTIESVAECVGYLTWTFYARRVKGNPTYYGAESGSDEHVQARLLAVVKQSLSELRESGCIEMERDDSDAIVATSLGIASAQYYLTYRTPKQMQVGIREARKIIANFRVSQEKTDDDLPTFRAGTKAKPLCRPLPMDEASIAWLLFVVCSTHEFDELPVRHNEEFLNEELSQELMWGPDTANLMSGNNGQPTYRNMEIFEDPHTKCFLLIQAYLERAKLPISDFVNDTKSVVENLPRLLAAMAYIASEEKTAAGSFELSTQFSRARQVFAARAKVDDDPLLQLPGFNAEVVRRMKSSGKGKHSAAQTLFELRSLDKKEVTALVQGITNSMKGRRHGTTVDQTIATLYGLPLARLTDASVRIETEKSTNKSVGKLKVVVEIDRQKKNSKMYKDKHESMTLTVLVGSLQQRMLLATESIRISRYGTWTVSKELTFDWSSANADGGPESGKVVLRLLLEEVRGLDSEILVNLK